MTVALFISADRMLEEYAMLNRLVVGLMNENMHVIRCLPKHIAEQFDATSHSAGLSEGLYFNMPCSFIERSSRRREVVDQMASHHTNAIVAFGRDAEQLALDVKKQLDIPICIELTSLAQASHIRHSQPVDAWLAPTHAVFRESILRVSKERVIYAPIGTQKILIRDHEPANVRCIIVLDASGNPHQTEVLLRQTKHLEDLHIFLELSERNHNKRIHQIIKSQNIEQRITCLGNASELRALIPSADALILPNAKMQLRSIVLEAMSAGVPIVCTPNDGYDMLIDDETALFVTGQYGEQLLRILNDKHVAQLIANNAHTLINKSYSSSKQIAAYNSLLSLF